MRWLFPDQNGDRVLELLRMFENRLKPADVENVREMVERNEWAIGFDIMCTQLYEWDSPITAEELGELRVFVNEGPMAWEEFAFLEKLVSPS